MSHTSVSVEVDPGRTLHPTSFALSNSRWMVQLACWDADARTHPWSLDIKTTDPHALARALREAASRLDTACPPPAGDVTALIGAPAVVAGAISGQRS